MSKVSKETEYAIKYLLESKKISPEEVSNELGIKLSIVNKFVATQTAPSKTDKTKNLMIRQTSAKKSNSVSIMTEGAAQLNDEFVKTLNQSDKNTSGYIFKPKG